MKVGDELENEEIGVVVTGGLGKFGGEDEALWETVGEVEIVQQPLTMMDYATAVLKTNPHTK